MSRFHFDNIARVPENIRFGTSSWNYPGWKNLVYFENYRNDSDFKSRSLAEYVRFPLFRTVGIDSSFYGPPALSTLRRYAEQVPADFQWIAKVWEEITIPRYASLPRYGEKAGKENPDYLNAEKFRSQVLERFSDPTVLPHCGPFVFQFQSHRFPSQRDLFTFLDRLRDFLSQLPQEFRYAVEIRDRELLCNEYFQTLNDTGATHCFNHWTRMPPLSEQMKAAARAGGLMANFFVTRILTPLEVSYEQAVRMFEPYGEVKRPNLEMRHDLIRLMNRAVERNAQTFIIVNNRSEGCAPITIDEVVSEYVRRAQDSDDRQDDSR